MGLAYTHTWQGRVDQAEEVADRALALATEKGDSYRSIHLMAVRGTCRWLGGDLAGSMRLYAEVRDRAARAGNVELSLKTELVLAAGLIRVGRYREAVPTVLHIDYLTVAITALASDGGLPLAASVRAITDLKGGTTQMLALGITDPRELAADHLDSSEVDRLWEIGT